ncbi:CRISPR system Cascade subunit CasC [Spinactinospora alkalitolerans]|uniref:CRISPR system Cascade subunit CasC n=1 Tax=Spinactinospora alkalitolerans TaxID=687207 RepID=A0A852UA15_9ACTN|nr:type I-E CRISPR-associated protein Cas7/Cse4/CasC [Spinactinospora alkalitolerans]NYE50954.1 CRISPR system Cascade subunit CasC [Spinactinospora alkalitolerans]
MTSPGYLDVHVLQTLPYSNINRDDLGSPKTVVYGGKERTRVSSQSWKRAVRHEVEARLGDRAVRTRRIIGEIAKRLEAKGWDGSLAEAGARQVVLSVGKVGIKLEKEKEGEPPATSVLFYLPASAFEELADIAAEHRDAIAKEAAKKTPKPVLPPDRITEVLSSRNASVNLFGRMLAELPSTEVDGAVQFAHAFTVHATAVEVDFFTAVDDVPKDNDRGSGHMNAGQFSAGTFYRYANVNLAHLLENFGGDADAARTAVDEFLRAFLSTVPSGKQNATAAMTLPDLAHIAVRPDRPVSFAPAFETALYGGDGYAARARGELDSYAGRLRRLWPDSAVRGYAAVEEKDDFAAFGDRHESYPDLIEAMVAAAFDRSGT